MLSIKKPQNELLVLTVNKDYRNPPSLLNNQATDQPNPSASTSSENIPPPIAPELTIKPPMGFVYKLTFNPRACAT